MSISGSPVVSGDSSVSVSGDGCGDGLSAAAAAGIAVAATLLATLPLCVALDCCGMWFLMRPLLQSLATQQYSSNFAQKIILCTQTTIQMNE